MPITKVLIVEDHPIFSRGLAELICSQPLYTVVGEAKNRRQAMDIAAKKKPELAVIDLNLGEEDGLDIIKNMHEVYPAVVMLVLSMHDERYYAERVIKAGARGYIMKDEAGANVLQAIKTVMSGNLWLSDAERKREDEIASGRGTGKKDFLSVLSDRQLEIFTLIGNGFGTIEIASRLGLSRKTVDSHKENMKIKLHCSSTQELRQLAVSWYSKR